MTEPCKCGADVELENYGGGAYWGKCPECGQPIHVRIRSGQGNGRKKVTFPDEVAGKFSAFCQ